MLGQGRPNPLEKSAAVRAGPCSGTRWLAGWMVFAFVSAWPLALAASPSTDGSSPVRLRITWGGVHPEAWTGTISATSGEVQLAAPLGFDPEAAASLGDQDGSVVIRPAPPTTYAGLDLWVPSAPDGSIEIRLTAENQPDFELTIPLSKILDGSVSEILGNDQSRLTISRAPGDALRVELQRSHLVFRPAELWTLQVHPLLTGLATRTATLKVRVTPAREDEIAIWSDSRTLTLELDGSGETTPIPVPIPRTEGVYDLHLELEGLWYQSPFQGRHRSVARKIQFVVLEPARPLDRSDSSREWEIVYRETPQPAERGGAWPAWNLRRSNRAAPLQNALVHSVELGDQTWYQLDAGGWQALSLSALRPGVPARVEVDYLDEIPSALGISLLEKDRAGQIRTIGFDSGVVIPASLGEGNEAVSTVRTHRFTVWPSGESATLLLANRDLQRPFLRGEVRVWQGPEALEPGTVEPPEGRGVMAQLRTPYWAEMFGGTQAWDDRVQQPLDDWLTFYTAADRLVQTLRHHGLTGAFVQIADDGSGLYPSQQFPPSPRLDSGVFFSSGQDPVRKDVLRMLLEMFEREGLVLVPTLSTTEPLPGVEAQRRGENNSVELVDVEGQPRRDTQSHLPRYNPLSVVVQREVSQWVGELADRYSDSAAWGGVGLACEPESYLFLPGRSWGYDARTLEQFLVSRNRSSADFDSPAAIRQALSGEWFSAWSDWRAHSLAAWHRDLSAEVRRSNGNAKLYLLPENLYRQEEIISALSPSLHGKGDVDAALDRLGLRPPDREQDIGLVIAAPHRLAPIAPLGKRRVEYQVARDPRSSAFFHTAADRVELFSHQSTWAHFAELQQLAFPDQQAPLMRYQPFTPAGRHNLRRLAEALKAQDSNLIIDGGWSLVQDPSGEWRSFLETYRRLPAAPFADVPCPQAAPLICPVAVRQLRQKDRWYGYAVNSTPWPIRINLNGGGESITLQPLGVETAESSPSAGGGEAGSLSVELPPFGLHAWESSDPDMAWSSFQFQIPEAVAGDLRHELQRIQSNLIRAKTVEPLAVLENPDFETQTDGPLPGWNIGDQSKESVRAETGASYSGLAYLRMQFTDRPVWIRSNEFRNPATGRLSVTVWLRTDDPGKQPPLRIAVEGRTGKRNYYRFGTVGGTPEESNGRVLTDQWQRFAVHFDDLPPEGMESLRIGFDLMGEGEIQLDGVHVYDRWLDENDTKKMTQILAGASKMLSDPNTLNGCRLTLESYWPRFLRTHFDDEFRIPDSNAAGGEPRGPRTSQRLLRLRSQTPRRNLPFR